VIRGCHVHHIIRDLIDRLIEHRFRVRDEAPEIDREFQLTAGEESITDATQQLLVLMIIKYFVDFHRCSWILYLGILSRSVPLSLVELTGAVWCLLRARVDRIALKVGGMREELVTPIDPGYRANSRLSR
jgi:hypothetical protein